MKILFIAAPFPYPPDTGSRNLIFHWLEAACRAHEVELLVIEELNNQRRQIPDLPHLRIEVLHVSVRRTLAARISRLAASATRGIPASSLIYMPPFVVERILEKIRSRSYDLVVLTENVVAGFAPLLTSRVPTVLFKHSVDAANAKDIRRRHGMFHARWLLEESILKRYEARTSRAASLVCCVNQEDSDELMTRYRLAQPPEIVPIGVELRRFPRRDVDPGGKIVAFFGNLTWGANSDAVIWFAEQVLPMVWEKHPDTVFRVIGPGAENLPLSSADPRIVLLGPVPQTQIAEAMKDVAVGVVPVISGTGVRLKLLEMLSMGVPAVSTPLGCLGTRCLHGEHLLVADGPRPFAAAVSLLLSDGELRQKLSRAGSRIAPTHAWENFYPRILKAFDLAVGHRAQASEMVSARQKTGTA